MRLFVALVLIPLILFSLVEAKGLTWPKVVLIGDSITQGSFSPTAPWGALLQDYFMRKADVIDRGLGGYTSRSYLTKLEIAVRELDPKSVGAVFMFLGANDCVYDTNPNHVPIPEFKKNLKTIITRMESIGVTKDRFIISSPAPVFNRNDRDPVLYVLAAEATAQELGVAFVNVHGPMTPEADKIFVDGLHFNANGAKIFFDLIRGPIEKKLLEYKGVNKLPDNYDQ